MRRTILAATLLILAGCAHQDNIITTAHYATVDNDSVTVTEDLATVDPLVLAAEAEILGEPALEEQPMMSSVPEPKKKD